MSLFQLSLNAFMFDMWLLKMTEDETALTWNNMPMLIIFLSGILCWCHFSTSSITLVIHFWNKTIDISSKCINYKQQQKPTGFLRNFSGTLLCKQSSLKLTLALSLPSYTMPNQKQWNENYAWAKCISKIWHLLTAQIGNKNICV